MNCVPNWETVAGEFGRMAVGGGGGGGMDRRN
jgi:hypothetical protein